MKFLACFLLATIFVLVLSDKPDKIVTGEYQLIEKQLDDSKPDKLMTAKYQLDVESAETEGETLAFPGTQLDPYRTCLVVQCFPKKWKYQICICRLWRK